MKISCLFFKLILREAETFGFPQSIFYNPPFYKGGIYCISIVENTSSENKKTDGSFNARPFSHTYSIILALR
jgi:hypothetical protein